MAGFIAWWTASMWAMVVLRIGKWSQSDSEYQQSNMGMECRNTCIVSWMYSVKMPLIGF